MRDVLDVVQKVAKLSATVLILGESGTGKELLARLIHREASASAAGPGRSAVHRRQPRRDSARAGREHAVRPRARLVHRRAAAAHRQVRAGQRRHAVPRRDRRSASSICRPSCCARSRKARSNASAASKPIRTTFRLIAATNVDLEKAVKDGTFRGDLFYRLNVIPLRLPPLRERLEDLPELAEFFLRSLQRAVPQARRSGIAESTLRMLVALLVARQHPRAREPDRARRGDVPKASGSPTTTCRSSSTSPSSITQEADEQPARSRAGHVRAQLHHSRARAQRLERDADGALSGRAAVDAEVQDGSAGDPRAGAAKLKGGTDVAARQRQSGSPW